MKRKPVFAYQGWYPSQASSLSGMIDEALPDSKTYPFTNSSIKAIISPHAGYVYSLKTACHAFKSIEGKKTDNVFVLGPSHRSTCKGKGVLPNFEAFETPLGTLNVNNALIDEMLEKYPGQFFADDDIHLNEHSLEMQLPIIASLLEEVTIVPIILPPSDITVLEKIGHALGEFLKDDSLIVISSDLSHFPTKAMADEIDKDSMNSWLTLNTKKIWDTEEKWRNSTATSCAMCGIAAIITGITALNYACSNLKVFLANHSTSFDASGDEMSVVGYGSAVIYSD